MKHYSITYDSIEGPYVITVQAKSAKNALNRVIHGQRLCDWKDIISVDIHYYD